MLLVHLFDNDARVDFYLSPLSIGDWLRLVVLTLPGLFC